MGVDTPSAETGWVSGGEGSGLCFVKPEVRHPGGCIKQ